MLTSLALSLLNVIYIRDPYLQQKLRKNTNFLANSTIVEAQFLLWCEFYFYQSLTEQVCFQTGLKKPCTQAQRLNDRREEFTRTRIVVMHFIQ